MKIVNNFLQNPYKNTHHTAWPLGNRLAKQLFMNLLLQIQHSLHRSEIWHGKHQIWKPTYRRQNVVGSYDFVICYMK